jgi:elongation factor P hydroxylase
MPMAASRVDRQGAVFSATRLERVFDDCFLAEYHTCLRGGAPEPLYEPGRPSILWYRDDFFASALHEVAHWCIAGEERRRQLDFGYWYTPDGRDARQQAAFEAVESKPQALEWYFSFACGYRFRPSLDNLGAASGQLPGNSNFRHEVCNRARHWQRSGLPRRAARFYTALCVEFDVGLSVAELVFDEESLR